MADNSESEFESDASVDSPKSLTDIDSDDNEEMPAPKPKEQVKPIFQCERCEKQCATPWGLKWHVAAKHKEEVAVQNPSPLDDDLKVTMVVQTLEAITKEPVLGAVGQRRKNLSGQLLDKIHSEAGSFFVKSLFDVVCSVVKNSQRVFSALKYEEALQRINAILNGKGDQLQTLRNSLRQCFDPDNEISDSLIDMVLSKICYKVFDKYQLELLHRRQQAQERSETRIKPLQGDELQSFEEQVGHLLRVYYASGSMRFKEHSMKSRLLCLREKFAFSVSNAELSASEFVSEKMWKGTECDIKISPMALKFFTCAEVMIRSLRTEVNAIVSTDRLIDLFLKEESQETMNLWFHLTAKYLSEKSAFGFMHSVLSQLLKSSNKTYVESIKRKYDNTKQLKKVSLRKGLKHDV